MAILWGTAGISVVIFGTAVFLAASAIHITILLTFFLLIYIAFSLVYLTERAYLAWQEILHRLPGMPCQEPPAGTLLSSLRRGPPAADPLQLRHPAPHLPLRREAAGDLLSETGDLLKSRCPDCQSLLETGPHRVAQGVRAGLRRSRRRQIRVSLLGGQPADGSRSRGAVCSPPSSESRTESELERVRQQLAQGRSPEKTLSTLPRAFNLKLQAAAAAIRECSICTILPAKPSTRPRGSCSTAIRLI